MFRNYLATALNNLRRNRLYAAISIGGLAVGMAAAILTGLYVRDEMSFDSFIPGYDQVFVATWTFSEPGRPSQRESWTVAPMAGWLKLDIPQVADAERMAIQTLGVSHGGIEAAETVAWTDPGFFRLLPYPAIAGDAAAALEQPNRVVMTRSMARKYFGQDKPIGQALVFRRQQPFLVAAVIEDYPGSSNIDAQIFASGRSAMSRLAQEDAKPYEVGTFNDIARTFVRLRDTRQVGAVNAAIQSLLDRRVTPPSVVALLTPGSVVKLTLVPISQMHLIPDTGASTPPSSPELLLGLAVIAVLILAAAVANFVNLMTARASRRAVEVGIRKVVGAEWRHLMLQFMGEALLYAAVALVCALALVELALPVLNSVMLRHIAFPYWRDPALMAFGLGLTAVTGLAAGAYPALLLSSFRPSAVLKGGLPRTAGSNAIRQGLVTLQFAVLILMLLGVFVVERQTRFALTKAAGVDTENLLRINLCPCRGAFAEAVAKLPGVRSTACSSDLAAGMGQDERSVVLPDGRTAVAEMGPVDFGFMEQLGVKPLAGRLLSADHPGDATPIGSGEGPCIPFGDSSPGRTDAPVLIDRDMVRAMHLPSPASAVGKRFRIRLSLKSSSRVQIVGVVPDIRFDLTRVSARPMFFFVDAACSSGLGVRIAPDRLPETMTAIGRLWQALGPPRPIREHLTDDYLKAVVYAGVIRQGAALTALALIAVLIAGLGMYALAAFTAERRTKEIGIRKAMGAGRSEILRLLLWQFTQPILWANLVAWPLGWWAMDYWLRGFSARIALEPGLFLAASAAALLIAWATVLAHTLKVAGAKPIGALRYE